MPTPQPPSLFWQGEIDPPVEQDATYQFDYFDRSYIDSQIRACETAIKNLSGGLSYVSVVQVCTAGGTIVSTATAGVGIVTLTGSPSAPFTYSLPTGAGSYQIVNKTGQLATVVSIGSTSVVVAGNCIVSTDGTDVYPPRSIAATQYLTNSSASKQIVITGQAQAVSVDATSGVVPAIAPTVASCVEGQMFGMKDNTASWGANQVSVAVESGTKIEDPQNPGTYVTGGTLDLVKSNGAGASWRLYKSLLTWGLA